MANHEQLPVSDSARAVVEARPTDCREQRPRFDWLLINELTERRYHHE